MKLTFVGTSAGNVFMNELLAAVAHEVRRCGVDAELVLDRFPQTDESVYVLVPHEYFATVPEGDLPGEDRLRRTIALCVEQPGTAWFELGYRHARRVAAAMDISVQGVRELRRRNLPVEHFRLGYTDYWDTWERDESTERDVDVVHMGTATPRRLQALATYGTSFWPHETRLLLPPVEPKPGPRPDFLVGSAKLRALRSSKMLLNVHRDASPYFEWVRTLETLANGCVLVSEHSEGAAPLVPGEHFVSGDVESLGLLADRLLRDEDRLRALRLAAYDFVREELTMKPAAQLLVDVAEHVRRGVSSSVRISPGDNGSEPEDAPAEGGGPAEEDERARVRVALERLALEQTALTRKMDTIEARIAGLDPDAVEVLAQTPAYAHAEPRVSVVLALYNRAKEVVRALSSVAASDYDSLELVVLDDGSSDGSADAVRAFFLGHPEIPCVLVGHPVNRGLGRTRNHLLRHSRGELVLTLDAGREVYPPAISRLVAALDEDPSALFAYPMLEVHENGRPITLRSYLPWAPAGLREVEQLDTLALFRRDQLIASGGYSEDHHLGGREDHQLWRSCAEHGLGGVLVPQILGRISYDASIQSALS